MGRPLTRSRTGPTSCRTTCRASCRPVGPASSVESGGDDRVTSRHRGLGDVNAQTTAAAGDQPNLLFAHAAARPPGGICSICSIDLPLWGTASSLCTPHRCRRSKPSNRRRSPVHTWPTSRKRRPDRPSQGATYETLPCVERPKRRAECGSARCRRQSIRTPLTVETWLCCRGTSLSSQLSNNSQQLQQSGWTSMEGIVRALGAGTLEQAAKL